MAAIQTPAAPKAYIVVGPKGTGKSYLCGLLAEDAAAFPRGNAGTHVTTAQHTVQCVRGRVVDTTGLDSKRKNKPNFSVCRGHDTYVILLVNGMRIEEDVTQLLHECGLGSWATPAQINVFNGWGFDRSVLQGNERERCHDREQLIRLVNEGRLSSFLVPPQPVPPPVPPQPVPPPVPRPVARPAQHPVAISTAPAKMDPFDEAPLMRKVPDWEKSFVDELTHLTNDERVRYQGIGDAAIKFAAYKLNKGDPSRVERGISNERMMEFLKHVIKDEHKRKEHLQRVFADSKPPFTATQQGNLFEATCYRMRFITKTQTSRAAYTYIVEWLCSC